MFLEQLSKNRSVPKNMMN